jgi:YHS domain-containing protein
MKNLLTLIALFLFIGLNGITAQDETSTTMGCKKTKTNHSNMNHEQDHSQMNHDMNSQLNHEMNHDTSAEPWNEVCPVRGGKVNNKVAAVEYNGKSYGFCCGGCDAKFIKDPQKYSKNLSDDGKKFVGKKS